MTGCSQAPARLKTAQKTATTITTNRFINLGSTGLSKQGIRGDWENDHKARETGERGNDRGKGDNYVVFPRSIFFWMARAEW